jgi:Domain of unknown function (DUF4192)
MTESIEDACDGVLRLHSPGDLLEAVPYLIGFHPSESLVLVGIRAGQVAVTVRLDLADSCGEALAGALDVLAGASVVMVIAVVYSGSNAAGETPTDSSLVGELALVAGARGLSLIEALRVDDGRWWSYADPFATPDGHVLPGNSSTTAATATFAGLVALPDRSALTAALDADPPELRATLHEPIAVWEDRSVQSILDGHRLRYQRSVKRAMFACARDADSTPPSPARTPSRDGQLCRFAAGLTDVAVRDALWLAIDQGRLDGRRLWQELLRRMPAPYDAAPLFLYGWACWRDGNGVLAREAAHRALRSDAGYTAAELLLSAIDSGLDPFRTPRLRMPRPS